MTEQTDQSFILPLVADVVSAYVSNYPVPAPELPALIGNIYQAFAKISGQGSALCAEPLKPAVPIRRSLQPDHLVCLEDGKKFKSLKRHLHSHHDMTPDEYRERWGLESGYPMVAPEYAQARSVFAKKMGLGRKTAKVAPGKPAKGVRVRGDRKTAS